MFFFWLTIIRSDSNTWDFIIQIRNGTWMWNKSSPCSFIISMFIKWAYVSWWLTQQTITLFESLLGLFQTHKWNFERTPQQRFLEETLLERIRELALLGDFWQLFQSFLIDASHSLLCQKHIPYFHVHNPQQFGNIQEEQRNPTEVRQNNQTKNFSFSIGSLGNSEYSVISRTGHILCRIFVAIIWKFCQMFLCR